MPGPGGRAQGAGGPRCSPGGGGPHPRRPGKRYGAARGVLGVALEASRPLGGPSRPAGARAARVRPAAAPAGLRADGRRHSAPLHQHGAGGPALPAAAVRLPLQRREGPLVALLRGPGGNERVRLLSEVRVPLVGPLRLLEGLLRCHVLGEVALQGGHRPRQEARAGLSRVCRHREGPRLGSVQLERLQHRLRREGGFRQASAKTAPRSGQCRLPPSRRSKMLSTGTLFIFYRSAGG
mmetsp:Transcript_10037/g.24719  ORF Transcript_10037/g.24719 Transcript_10037/m.24719 type:complete len:237 (-) Transcript_10037:560-1270(-)